MTLLPCPSCQRHVREGEPRCPFCANELSTASSSKSPARVPRLPRAAMFLFAASTAVATAAVAGCGSDESTGTTPPVDSGGGDSAKDTAIVDSGGGTDSSGTDTSVTDSGEADTGSATDSGGGTDAAKDTDGGPAPLYGAPPYP